MPIHGEQGVGYHYQTNRMVQHEPAFKVEQYKSRRSEVKERGKRATALGPLAARRRTPSPWF